jgi:hypothetical protein
MQITGDFVFAMGLWGVIGSVLSVVAMYSLGNTVMATGGGLQSAGIEERRKRRVQRQPYVNLQDMKTTLGEMKEEMENLYQAESRLKMPYMTKERKVKVNGVLGNLYEATHLVEKAQYFLPDDDSVFIYLEKAHGELKAAKRKKHDDSELAHGISVLNDSVGEMLQQLNAYRKKNPLRFF